MPRPHLVFGSSKDLLRKWWRVWTYDAETRQVMPLGEYADQVKSDVAAFDLAHSSASWELTWLIPEILAGKDSDPMPLSEGLTRMLAVLAEDAIQMSQAPEQSKSAVTTTNTPDNTVHVVCIAGRDAF